MPDDNGKLKLEIVKNSLPDNAEVQKIGFGSRIKCPPTSKKNPFGITRYQHLLPKRTLQRVASEGSLDLLDIERRIRRPAKCDDTLFCEQRCWDQYAETTMSHSIEADFQNICDEIQKNPQNEFNKDQIEIINRFFSLWSARANCSEFQVDDLPLSKIQNPTAIEQIKKDEFEKNGGLYAENNKVPRRFVHRLILEHHMNRIMKEEYEHWYPWIFEEGECIFSTFPILKAIPITNKIVLLTSRQRNIKIDKNTEEFNRQLLEKSRENARVFFSNNLDRCLGISGFIRRFLSKKSMNRIRVPNANGYRH